MSITWVKSKEKLSVALAKGNNVKRQKLRFGDHETLDTAVFKWVLSLRSQNVPLSGSIIQEKASQYAKELSIENVKVGYVDGRIETTLPSKQYLENQIQ